MNKDYLTIREAASYCGVSVRQFHRRINESQIPSTYFMGKRLFRRDDLKAAIEKMFQII